MKIEAARGHVTLSPGDFSAAVKGDVLEVPTQLASVAANLGVFTAEALVSYLHAFPSAVAAGLKWDASEVDAAKQGLTKALTGHVDTSILEPTESFRGAFGAFDPQDRDK